MTNEERISYAEVLTILDQMDPIYQAKIPKKLIAFFRENCQRNHSIKVNLSKPLNKQNLNKKTLSLLAILDLNYWCKSEK